MEEKEVQNNKKIELVFPETNLEVESKFVRKSPGEGIRTILSKYRRYHKLVQTVSS